MILRLVFIALCVGSQLSYASEYGARFRPSAPPMDNQYSPQGGTYGMDHAPQMAMGNPGNPNDPWRKWLILGLVGTSVGWIATLIYNRYLSNHINSMEKKYADHEYLGNIARDVMQFEAVYRDLLLFTKTTHTEADYRELNNAYKSKSPIAFDVMQKDKRRIQSYVEDLSKKATIWGASQETALLGAQASHLLKMVIQLHDSFIKLEHYYPIIALYNTLEINKETYVDFQLLANKTSTEEFDKALFEVVSKRINTRYPHLILADGLRSNLYMFNKIFLNVNKNGYSADSVEQQVIQSSETIIEMMNKLLNKLTSSVQYVQEEATKKQDDHEQELKKEREKYALDIKNAKEQAEREQKKYKKELEALKEQMEALQRGQKKLQRVVHV